MSLTLASPCKVNLLLNILGKRSDGFHELETVMQPVPLFDRLHFKKAGSGLELTCTEPGLPVDSTNLVYRAAQAFLAKTNIPQGVRIHLEKQIPMAAGLGGGSGNAATTLLGLNELFGKPLQSEQLHEIAATLGSDIPFFLQHKPALCTGRGEKTQSLEPFPALDGLWILLIYPGFGVPTAWAYQHLAQHPDALNGKAGRASALLKALGQKDPKAAVKHFYNSLEAPVLEKYPILALYQEFLRANGAIAARMSGSGSTTFALAENHLHADALRRQFNAKFPNCWNAAVAL